MEIKEDKTGGNVACMGEKGIAFAVLVGNLKGTDLHFDHRQILKWILRKQDGRAQNGFI
jgi:hypothetical protein